MDERHDPPSSRRLYQRWLVLVEEPSSAGVLEFEGECTSSVSESINMALSDQVRWLEAWWSKLEQGRRRHGARTIEIRGEEEEVKAQEERE